MSPGGAADDSDMGHIDLVLVGVARSQRTAVLQSWTFWGQILGAWGSLSCSM